MTVNHMNLAPRCTATSKRSGMPCKAPAVRGWSVCRFHGARGGAPTGKKHGNYRHGACTNEVMAEVKWSRRLVAEVEAALAEMG